LEANVLNLTFLRPLIARADEVIKLDPDLPNRNFARIDIATINAAELTDHLETDPGSRSLSSGGGNHH
jgi:hypothetical protein